MQSEHHTSLHSNNGIAAITSQVERRKASTSLPHVLKPVVDNQYRGDSTQY